MCPTVGRGPQRDITRRWSTRWNLLGKHAGTGGIRMDGRGAVDPLHIENRCPKGLAGWAGDGMTEPPTSSADLAAPRARDELLATKVSIPRARPDRLARCPAGRGGLVPSPSVPRGRCTPCSPTPPTRRTSGCPARRSRGSRSGASGTPARRRTECPGTRSFCGRSRSIPTRLRRASEGRLGSAGRRRRARRWGRRPSRGAGRTARPAAAAPPGRRPRAAGRRPRPRQPPAAR
jgi:hypothetical protein